jgi:hypothetical protein
MTLKNGDGTVALTDRRPPIDDRRSSRWQKEKWVGPL